MVIENEHLFDNPKKRERKNRTEQMNQNSMEEKFTQTFFKYMMNMSNRQFVNTVNTHVDYNDKSLVFYCRSDELLPLKK